MEAWYVFHAKPRCESRALEALIARGATTYAPRVRPGPNGPGELLFPAYLFVYGDPAAAGMAKWRYLPGLGELVSFGGEPAIVPPQVIAWLRARGGDFARDAPGSDRRAAEDRFLTDLQIGLQEAVGPQERVDTLLRFLCQASEVETPGGTASDSVTADTKLRHHRSTRGGGRRISYR